MTTLNSQSRTVLGKKVKALRRRGLVPAVFLGAKLKSVPLALNEKEANKVWREAGESALIDLLVDGESVGKTLISEVQKDPVGGQIIHVNLHKVEMKQKVTAPVPIEVAGESPVVKRGEGILLVLLDEVEVECLPADLPSEIKIDISRLNEVDEAIVVGDLPLDFAKVNIVGHKSEEPILKIGRPAMEEEKEGEEAAAEAKPEDVEATREKKEEGAEETGAVKTPSDRK